VAGAIITSDTEETLKRKEGLKLIKKTRAKVLRKGSEMTLTVHYTSWGCPVHRQLALNSGGFLGMPTRS